MLSKHDLFLTTISVCVQNPENGQTIGSAVFYKHKTLGDKVYILTAAHCLFYDGDQFEEPIEKVKLQLFNHNSNGYATIDCTIDFGLVSASAEKDVAVIVLNLEIIEELIGVLPEVQAVQERHSITSFVGKGFPNATMGRELVAIEPKWVQDLPGHNVFQLHLNQDFSTPESARSQVDGFSGCGLFLVGTGNVYLYGIFTRFLEAGKLIYGQYLTVVNELLKNNFLPAISFTFFGNFGLTPEFFRLNAIKTVENLGPRFNEKLNLRLPLAFKFNDLAKDGVFKHRFFKAIDAYLTENNYGSRDHEGLIDLESSYVLLKEYVNQWYVNIDWSPVGTIDNTELYTRLNEFGVAANTATDLLYDKRSKILKEDKGKNKNYNYSPPLTGELNRVREMVRSNNNLREELEELDIDLSNSPVLILKGEAGSGKSHLFGDIVSLRNSNGQPAILLLGQLFKKEQTIWQNILNQLDLRCTKLEFLETLNIIGRQTGSRVLLLIDAINEGAAKELWHGAIAGFIHDISPFKYIGLALSIRSTYWNTIIPQNIKSDTKVTKITHEGFRGNEYKALQLYCAYYDIRQPNFPILTPEYTSPLFLQLICQGIKASGEKNFPAGFQGISKIFDYYTKAITSRLAEKRPIYQLRKQLVKTALENFAAAAFEKEGGRSITIEDALDLFDNRFGQYPDLLIDLIEEGVLVRGVHTSYDGVDEDWEIVYFSYERFGDFYMANQLIAPFKTKAEIKAAFAEKQPLGNMAEDRYRYSDGILEAFAVLLPEKHQLEITEVYNWLFARHSDMLDNTTVWLTQWMINSLKWREISSIDDEKITKWIRESGNFRMDINNYLYFLVETTAAISHPFNSDRLHRFLNHYNMSERDGFWQSHMQGYHGKDDDEIAFPITRLMDWAWQLGISKLTNQETARLTGQTLAWLLSSTNRGLRDQTTKAMVNLLQDQPAALVQILDAFLNIDDLYISERLYAVCYGCALRSIEAEKLEILARAVYNRVFLNGNPPEHILLRDYARNSVEYAISRGLLSDVDHILIKPPYNSQLPAVFPTEADVKALEIDHTHPEYKAKNGSAKNQILHSVLRWDFARYTIDGTLSNFSPLRFTLKKEIDQMLNTLPRGSKKDFNLFEKYHEMRYDFNNRQPTMVKLLGEEQAEYFKSSVEKIYIEVGSRIRSRLNDSQLYFLENEILPYWDLKIQIKHGKEAGLEKSRIKRWIANRVFELGYDSEVHGQYDTFRRDYENSSESRVERIGKKYQWIAFHQMMAILSDNYKVSEFWSNDESPRYYSGPWELMLRDIDPSFTMKGKRAKYPEDDFGIVEQDLEWWSMEKYEYWYRLPSDWANTTADLPSPVKAIQKTDDKGTEWVYLKMSYTWKEPKLVGRDRWDDGHMEIWYMFQAYFVKRSEAQTIIDWLKKQNFFGRWLPENHTETELFARENFWSPMSKQSQKSISAWQTLRNSPYKVMLATSTAIGELSADKSGAHFDYLMPCKKLFDTLGLRYADQDGEFENSDGEIIVTNASLNGCMIRKDFLSNFLKAHNLEIVWVLLGEKNSFNKENDEQDFRKSMSGVYYFDGNILTGKMSVANW